MNDTIIFEAGNFGEKAIYAFDGTNVTELFAITGTLRTAEDLPNGFLFVESSATEPTFDLRVYEADTQTVATVFTEDAPVSGPGAAFLQGHQGGVLFKDYSVAGSAPVRFYKEGATTILVEDTGAPFNDRFNGDGDYVAWLGIAGETIYTSGGTSGNELAISNGVPGDTVFEDLDITSTLSNGSPRDFVSGDGGTYFVADFANGGAGSFTTNASGIVFGDANGAIAVLTQPDDPGGAPNIADIAYAGDTLFVSGRRPLSASDTTNQDVGLFRLDTDAPFALELIASVIDGHQINPTQLVDFDGDLLFESGGNLFFSDGTGAGTRQLTTDLSAVTTLSAGETQAFFWGTTSDAGQELWVTDGTQAGTSRVRDLNPGTSGQQGLAITVLEDVAYFQAVTDSVAGLFASDGTEDGTSLVLAGGRTPIAVSLGQNTAAPNQPLTLINETLGPQPGLIDATGVSSDRNGMPGTPGNDTVGSLGRSERLDLLEGVDRFIISTPSQGFLKEVADDVVELSNGPETYVLENVERVSFVDGTLYLDTDAGETAGSAYRLYQAAFNRTPDNDGLAFWLGVMDNGLSLQETAGFFLTSDEFETTYGTNLSNADYVDRLYENVLQREGDPDGVAFWRDVLDSNAATRSDVLAFFSESPENVQGLAPVIDDGFFLV